MENKDEPFSCEWAVKNHVFEMALTLSFELDSKRIGMVCEGFSKGLQDERHIATPTETIISNSRTIGV